MINVVNDKLYEKNNNLATFGKYVDKKTVPLQTSGVYFFNYNLIYTMIVAEFTASSL